jgi:type III secretory pathway lipoprotein EscJ
MEQGWVKVYKTDKDYQADIVVELLDENGIMAVKMNKRDSSYLAFGNIEVYVEDEYAEKALQIIKESAL